MWRRSWLICAIAVACVASAAIIPICIGAVMFLYEEYKIRRADVTAIFKPGVITLSQHFAFSRVCVFPLQTFWFDPSYEGYEQVQHILPDYDVYWTVVLVDDLSKTYRVLVVENSRVEYVGERTCASDLRLFTESDDGKYKVTLDNVRPL